MTGDMMSGELARLPSWGRSLQGRITSIFRPTAISRLGISFWLFGLINNVLYVIILSAALDLVPATTPKGIIAFCNIAPALVAKVAWPYASKGRIRYGRRVIGCCALSFAGMVVVAAFESVAMRLLGIALASFSSGLGELTFLQLSTTYHQSSFGAVSVGYFASGTGAAGLVGAFLWWEVRGLGVRTGVGLSSILPFVLPLVFFSLLPNHAALSAHIEDIDEASLNQASAYAPVPTSDNADDAEAEIEEALPLHKVSLTSQDKWRLMKPMILRYMVPLFCVYTFEYTINQGIAPTLLYPVPTREGHPILSRVIHSIRDYYPLWQLVYQSTVFLSRSSISLGIPALPSRLISLPSIVQFFILVTLATESAIGFFPDDAEGIDITFVFLLISLEGICGGLAYVNVFYHVNQEQHVGPAADDAARERAKQEKEFCIGSIGLADSSGILLASLLAIPTEMQLCKAQVARGRTLCRQL